MKHLLNSSFKLLLVAAAVSTVVGCGTYQELVDGQKTAYKSAKKRESGLDIPPDLTAQSPDEQFLIPGENPGAVTASTYNNRGAGQGVLSGVRVKSEPVLVSTQDIKIKQTGKIRSLEVKMPPDQLWPKLREFWKDVGFELSTDDPRIGLMETNWLENRANIPVDGVRKVIGSVFDGIFSSNQRDRYRTRVEPLDNGSVEVFITHRGMEENYIDQKQDQSVLQWMNRPNDPELEAEMLNKLMVKLTGDADAAKQAGRTLAQDLISVRKDKAGTALVVAEEFPVAWRRVGLGLDRAGFVVEDRDRANGVYYVKYAPDSASKEKSSGGGFLSRIFGGGAANDDKSLKENQRFQVIVASEGRQATTVKFTSERGSAVDSKVSDEAANKLAAKLRQ